MSKKKKRFDFRGFGRRTRKRPESSAGTPLTTARSVALAAQDSVPAADRRPGSWLAQATDMLDRVDPVDVSEPYAWFWDEAPDDEGFSLADIPGLIPPGFENSPDPVGMVMEGDAPSRGLAWSTPTLGECDLLPGTTPPLDAVTLIDAAGWANVSSTVTDRDMADGRAAALMLEGGIVRRAGAFVTWHSGPLPAWIEQWLDTVTGGSHRVAGLLDVRPYAVLAGDGLPEGGVLDATPLAYAVALDAGGRPIVGDGDEMPVGFLDERLAGDQDPETFAHMLRGQRSVALPVLFAFSCFNDATRKDGEARMTDYGHDGHGPVRKLRIDTLRNTLNSRTKGGLGQALSVLEPGSRHD